MRSLVCLAILIAMLISLPPAALAAQADGLDIQVIDGQISIYAEAVGLGDRDLLPLARKAILTGLVQRQIDLAPGAALVPVSHLLVLGSHSFDEAVGNPTQLSLL